MNTGAGLPNNAPDSPNPPVGTRYGDGTISGGDSKLPLSEEEKSLCRALGKRLAETAKRLQKNP